MKPRQIVHTLLIISEILLYASLLSISIIGCVKKDRKKKIWFASKILTLKQIIIDNMYNTYPLKDIQKTAPNIIIIQIIIIIYYILLKLNVREIIKNVEYLIL